MASGSSKDTKEGPYNQYYRDLTDEECIDVVAETIASVLRFSTNESFRKECFGLLEVANSGGVTEAIKVKLAESITKTKPGQNEASQQDETQDDTQEADTEQDPEFLEVLESETETQEAETGPFHLEAMESETETQEAETGPFQVSDSEDDEDMSAKSK